MNGRRAYDFGGEPLEGAAKISGLVDLDTHVGYVERGSRISSACPS